MAPKIQKDNGQQQYITAWRATLEAMKSGDSISGHERNMAFLNRPDSELQGGRSFADISAVTGLDFADDARGLALVDWDRDGDLDLWFRNRSAPSLRLMINGMNSGQFIAFRLEGTEANRDGIGARIEVNLEEGGLLVKSLAAGSGFLSQSSKWLHFGLGEGAKIRSVEVQWPFGKSETFTGVEPGSWWDLKQGSGAARQADVTPQPQPLKETEQPLPQLDSGRTLLPASVPLPVAEFLNPKGEKKNIAAPDRVRLVTFWTSWCPHCKAELKALAAGAPALKAAGVDVLAVNVDTAIEGPRAEDAELRALIEQAGFPFSWGRSEGEALQKVKHLEHALLDRDTELTVPYSCLLDENGEAAAFYRGPVDIARVVSDAALLSKSDDIRRAAIAGFGGRTFSPPLSRAAQLTEVGIQFQECFPLEAIRYLKMELPSGPVDLKNHPVTRRIAALAFMIGLAAVDEKNNADAVILFQEAIKFRPDLLEARLNLSVALFRLNRAAEAKSALEELLQIDPNHPAALSNLKVISEKIRKDQN